MAQLRAEAVDWHRLVPPCVQLYGTEATFDGTRSVRNSNSSLTWLIERRYGWSLSVVFGRIAMDSPAESRTTSRYLLVTSDAAFVGNNSCHFYLY